MQERIIAITIAFVLDLILGDPAWLWHPVRGIGSLISQTERMLRKGLHIRDEREADRKKKYIAGAVLVLIVLFVSTGIPVLLLRGAAYIHPWVRLAVEAVMCYQLIAMKSLRTESMKVYEAVKSGDVVQARYAVSMIVGRDTERLDMAGVTRAAVETVAENTSDGVAAPLLFMMIFGAAGGFFYKAVNTMDSMVGYRNDRYLYMGTAAARLDDVLNFIPARLSALLMVAAAGCTGLDLKNALMIFRRDRLKHASPNSAQTEAACAGALNVCLGGDAYYFGRLHRKPAIGDDNRSIETEDIRRANRLMYVTSFLMFFLGGSVMLCISLL